MNHERLKRVQALFDGARELDPGQRVRFLESNCGEDRDLINEINSLLDIDGKSGPLDFAPTISILPIKQLIAGRFRIIRYVAEGGMGTVYEAEDLKLRDRVALKVIRADIASNPKALERFRKEVLLGKRVTHPNVCRVYDLGIDYLPDGSEFLFLTMQFLCGETLASRLKRAILSEREALPLIGDLTDALSAAHQAGVIHRDFKSGNIILVGSIDRERAVVTDFGLAHSLEDDKSSINAGVVGTVDYMAPEQIRGEPLTPAADIYALGIVMYEMVAGKRPFAGDSNVAIALKHLNESPKRPREHSPKIDPNWDDVILTCLRKKPSERFQTAQNVKAALARQYPKARTRLFARTSKSVPALTVLGFSVIAMAVAIASLTALVRHTTHPPVRHDQSVAVLPFQDIGDTPESYSFGFTEEVMNALGQVPELRVIGPETSLRFKGSKLSPTEIGQKIDAHYVLIGSVHHLNHQVRAIVRMVDTSDGTQIWSRDFSRDERDVLLLPDDIARVLSGALNIQLVGTQFLGQSIDAGGLTARDLYWTGRFLFHQRSGQSVTKSLEYFREAVKHDPNFAEAYCGIADALFVSAERGLLPPEQALAEARNAAHRALELNSRLPAAYVSLAQVTSVYDRDLDAAERLFRRALTLDPKLAPGWQWLSYQLAKQRRFPEAIQAGEASVTADPLSTAANINLAVVYFYAGSYDHAMQQSRKLAQMDPALYVDHLLISEIFATRGLFSEAIHELESVPEANQKDPITMRVRVEVYALAGRKDQAKEALDRLLTRSREGGVPPSYLAVAYAATGDRENAFAWLERAYEERDAFASISNTYPAFSEIRSDPRWVPLMARFGFKEKMASNSSAPGSTGAATSQVSPGYHRVFPELSMAEEAAIQAQICARLGFQVQDGLDPPAEHQALAA